MFFIYARINGWVNTGEAGDLRRHHADYDVIVMLNNFSCQVQYLSWSFNVFVVEPSNFQIRIPHR